VVAGGAAGRESIVTETSEPAAHEGLEPGAARRRRRRRRRPPPPVVPAGTLDRVVEALLAAIVAGSALAIGTVHLGALTTVTAAITVLVALALLNGLPRLGTPWPALVAIGLAPTPCSRRSRCRSACWK
jgi:hypothetical protein